MSSTSWNTRNLGLRSGADIAAAASAGVLVAPVITMIDRSIIENASGRATLRASLANSLRTLLTRPQAFILTRPFFLIFTLYTGTYVTANTLDTVSSTLRDAPANSVTSGLPKFAATSSANLALCLYKDSQFTRLFAAPGATPRAIPLPTYALFTLRDCLTVFASFNVPPILAPILDERLRHASGTVAAKLRKHVDAASAAQFVAPAAVQIVSTPMHLLGLDLYNRHDAGWRQRAQKVRREWFASCLARMGRIVPAFGVGGVVNMRVRKSLLGRLEDRDPVVLKV
ncbi:uncharacterized protein K452DRAFT_221599 [Aplosporella prunicola CBS 121167]|uniref:Sequence orphan n=1 Tax=Aplosporella prunicola CBS 121167 TaxID=1176127 RepID=A0A6A6BR32_9PEZI|nr:uncharacterized protein K452DRAFT_221599 [Aplosporella prunicola CBS 121167]KAF2145267.1 hypothetical protein K452DRAFT_221599 [Aplosporella prunicola CBS 121167]